MAAETRGVAERIESVCHGCGTQHVGEINHAEQAGWEQVFVNNPDGTGGLFVDFCAPCEREGRLAVFIALADHGLFVPDLAAIAPLSIEAEATTATIINFPSDRRSS